ncbi:MAG: hypothetical protein ACXVHX_32925 [Solirubrobacteraceae bacterium]
MPPDQVPSLAVSVPPVCAVPEMTGLPVFAGGATEPAGCVTATVGAERLVVLPYALEAVTRDRRVEPSSASTMTYFGVVAPGIRWQWVPLALQRCQAYVNDVGAFRHDPLVVVRV